MLGASPLLKTELKEEKDTDVVREEERVGALADPAAANDVVVLKDLKKVRENTCLHAPAPLCPGQKHEPQHGQRMCAYSVRLASSLDHAFCV
jgi:hypothetical protein